MPETCPICDGTGWTVVERNGLTGAQPAVLVGDDPADFDLGGGWRAHDVGEGPGGVGLLARAHQPVRGGGQPTCALDGQGAAFGLDREGRKRV